MRTIPMTRRGLQAAVPERLRPAIVEWFRAARYADVAVPQVLREAGYSKLKPGHHGVERTVLVGPRVIIKTQGWRDRSPAWTRYRKSRVLCPTIQIALKDDTHNGIVAQPKGRVLCRLGARARTAKVDRRAIICERFCENFWECGDTHSGNLALFPDGTVRQIDY